jgi:hypothetical protein
VKITMIRVSCGPTPFLALKRKLYGIGREVWVEQGCLIFEEHEYARLWRGLDWPPPWPASALPPSA